MGTPEFIVKCVGRESGQSLVGGWLVDTGWERGTSLSLLLQENVCNYFIKKLKGKILCLSI